MLGGFMSWLIYGPDDDDDGFVEAHVEGESSRRSSSGRRPSLGGGVAGKEGGDVVARRKSSRGAGSQDVTSIETSGGGLIDLQCGRRVFNDVPANMRTELWMSQLHSKGGKGAMAVEMFEEYVSRGLDPHVLTEIDKDTHRTFPGHATLSSEKGHNAMLKVLGAYAVLDPEVGYSQGMNFLAGILLTYLSPPEAFGALTLVMQDRGLRDLYKPNGMTHLQARLWQLSRLIPKDLEAHMEENMILPVLYASSWLLTCFASEFPIKFAARVMDVVITDSYDIPMMKVALELLIRCKEEVMKLDDMEDIVDLLRKQLPKWPESRLQDLLTCALGSQWTPEQVEILRETNNTETVTEAISRLEKIDKEVAVENEISGNNMASQGETSGHGWEPEWEAPETRASFEGAVVNDVPQNVSYPNSPHMGEAATDRLEKHINDTNTTISGPHALVDPFQSLSIDGFSQTVSTSSPFDSCLISQQDQDASSDVLNRLSAHSSGGQEWSMSYQNSLRNLLSKVSFRGSSSQAILSDQQLKDWVMSTSINWSASSKQRAEGKASSSNRESPSKVDDDIHHQDYGNWASPEDS
eukprot:jgi/Picsp_1/630/NSC_00626-R1_tbc1 domain family member 4